MILLTTHFLNKPDTDEFRGHRTDVYSGSLASRQLALPINDAFLRQVDGDRAAGLSLTSVALLRCLVTPLCLPREHQTLLARSCGPDPLPCELL